METHPHSDRLALLGLRQMPDADRHVPELRKFLCGEPFDNTRFYADLVKVGAQKFMPAIQHAFPDIEPSIDHFDLDPKSERRPPPGIRVNLWFRGDSATLTTTLAHVTQLQLQVNRISIIACCMDEHDVGTFIAELSKPLPLKSVDITFDSIRISDPKVREQACKKWLVEVASHRPLLTKVEAFRLETMDVDVLNDTTTIQAWQTLIQATPKVTFNGELTDLQDAVHLLIDCHTSVVTDLSLREEKPRYSLTFEQLADIVAIEKRITERDGMRQGAADAWRTNWMAVLHELMLPSRGLVRLDIRGPGQDDFRLGLVDALELFLPHHTMTNLSIHGSSTKWTLGGCVAAACRARNIKQDKQNIKAASVRLAGQMLTAQGKYILDLATYLGQRIETVAHAHADTAQAVLAVGTHRATWERRMTDHDLEGILEAALSTCLERDLKRCAAAIMAGVPDLDGPGYHVCYTFVGGVNILVDCLQRHSDENEAIPYMDVFATIVPT